MNMATRDVVLATTNKGKIRELADSLSAFGINVVGLENFPQIGEVEENGATFEENALIKAQTVARASGLLAIADDSGLMVDALGGQPGVHSARYGSDWPFLPGETRDGRNIRKLLHEMASVPAAQRACHFVTAMAAADPTGRHVLSRGEWAGQVLTQPVGSNGFGYDPVFFDPELQRSAAQLTREEKNSRSHRGKALAGLLKILPEFMA